MMPRSDYIVMATQAENDRLKKEVERLKGIIDILTAPPMTTEEAEAALDDLPELSDEERAAMEKIDIEKIIKAATDSDNASPEWMVGQLAEAAEACSDFDADVLAKARSWQARRLCL